MQTHLVSIDDLTDTLTRCASLADKALQLLPRPALATPADAATRKALLQIKWEAHEAVDRAYLGKPFEDVS